MPGGKTVAAEAGNKEDVEGLDDEPLSFEQLYAEDPEEEETEDEDESSEDDSKDKPAEGKASEGDEKSDESEDLESEEPNKASKKGGKGFHFNADKYKEKGITDEKALDELEKQEKRVWEKDKTIGRQGHELGDLRKNIDDIAKRRAELKDQTELTDEEFNELNAEDPAKARKRADAVSKAKQEDEGLRQSEIELKNKLVLNEKVPEYESLVDDISRIIKADLPDEVSDQAISKFKQNPYMLDAPLAMNLAKRAIQEKQITELKSEVEKLSAELKKSPQKVMRKIDEMTKAPHSIGTQSGKSGKGKPSVGYTDILSASPEQLNEMLKEASDEVEVDF